MFVILTIIWMSCYMFSIGLIFIRKLILLHNGYPPKGPIRYQFIWIDARELDELAETENSHRIRLFFKWINILIPALFIIGVFLALLSASFSP